MVPLSVGRNVISVEVTAEDSVVTRVYTVTVTRAGPGGIQSTDATLRALTLSDDQLRHVQVGDHCVHGQRSRSD